MDRDRGTAKRERRIDVRQPVIVINSDGMEIGAILLDISSSGFRIELDDQLRVGEFVSLRIDEDLEHAQIRWVLGNEAGGSFLTAVDFSTL